MENKKNELLKDEILDEGPFYHGTRADLKIGDLLTAGYRSNYHGEVIMNHIYFTALKGGAGLAAELIAGEGRELTASFYQFSIFIDIKPFFTFPCRMFITRKSRYPFTLKAYFCFAVFKRKCAIKLGPDFNF